MAAANDMLNSSKTVYNAESVRVRCNGMLKLQRNACATGVKPRGKAKTSPIRAHWAPIAEAPKGALEWGCGRSARPLKCAPVRFSSPDPAPKSVNIASLATRTAGWLRTSAFIPSLHCRNMLAVAQQTRSAASPVARCEGRTCAMQQRLAPLHRGLSQRLGAKPAAAVPWAPALSRHRARPFGRHDMHEYNLKVDVPSSSARISDP
jgi:hypothetical protein